MIGTGTIVRQIKRKGRKWDESLSRLPQAAPRPMPASQIPKMVPRTSSVPYITTRLSRMRIVWNSSEEHPVAKNSKEIPVRDR